jgi:hypothetical protein
LADGSCERAIGRDNGAWVSWNELSFGFRLVVERLLAPLDTVPRWAVVVLEANEWSLMFRQGRQQLSLLQLLRSRTPGPWSRDFSRQPLWQ